MLHVYWSPYKNKTPRKSLKQKSCLFFGVMRRRVYPYSGFSEFTRFQSTIEHVGILNIPLIFRAVQICRIFRVAICDQFRAITIWSIHLVLAEVVLRLRFPVEYIWSIGKNILFTFAMFRLDSSHSFCKNTRTKILIMWRLFGLFQRKQ